MAQHWLLKTEPSTYSFETLLKEGKTNWNGVRNFQARNNLRKIQKGDLALIYHSGDDKAVVGVARALGEAYRDSDPEGGDWSQVDLKAVEPLKRPVQLVEIKKNKKLADLPLIRQSRLSVMPITALHYDEIIKMSR